MIVGYGISFSSSETQETNSFSFVFAHTAAVQATQGVSNEGIVTEILMSACTHALGSATLGSLSHSAAATGQGEI